jgi:hypothetical protein
LEAIVEKFSGKEFTLEDLMDDVKEKHPDRTGYV